MRKHKKAIYVLWRVSHILWLLIFAVRLFEERSPAVKVFIKTPGYQISVLAAISIALVFGILCSVIAHKEKRR